MSNPRITHHKIPVPENQDFTEIEETVVPECRSLFLETLRATESHHHEYEEKCQAYPLLLADQTVTFLREDSRTHILVMSEGKKPEIEFIPAQMVQPEQFMLFKNSEDETSEFFGNTLLKQHGVDWKKEMEPWKTALKKNG